MSILSLYCEVNLHAVVAAICHDLSRGTLDYACLAVKITSLLSEVGEGWGLSLFVSAMVVVP